MNVSSLKSLPQSILVMIFLGAGQVVFAQISGEIIDRMEEVMRGESSRAEMTMTIERPRYTREVSMRAWALGTEYSLILITAPARDQGITYLKRNNEIWNYVPNIDRTIKMPPSMMSQSWMGSDFTNDDLVRESSTADDYEHSIYNEEVVDGREAWVLELIPRPDTPIVWGKVLMWVDMEHYIQLKAEHYDQQGDLVNTMIFSEIGEMGGRVFPAKMTITPSDKPDQRTILEYKNLEFNVDISESFFTQQNMKRVR